ncbi:MAG: acyl--CoA ligase [Butyrivibrio sp.]|nr:acyl--CoA ligase [Butyrivibrio sp.]
MKSMNREMVFADIRQNHNHSWFQEIYQRNKNNLEKVSLIYRDSKYTYGEFFELVNSYAKALKSYGVGKGDEFVVCLRQSPDYPILVAAASLIGAIVNLTVSDFNKDYIADIIDKADADIVLVNDWDFATIAYSLKKSVKLKNIVVLPMNRWEKNPNPFVDITDRFYKFDEKKYLDAVKDFDNIIDVSDFLKHGENYEGELDGHGRLSDEIAITYTSGSTSKGIHKGVAQRNETYIYMGRYHDPEVCGIPRMDKLVTWAAIGTQADTTLLSGVSDTLIQGGAVALDPIIDEEYFIYAIKNNRARMVIGTTSYWLRAMKMTEEKSDLRGVKLPYLYVPCAGGEPLSAGEEKALNHWLKRVKAGTSVTHTPFSITKMTIGGGDSEHGSIFLSLFRGYFNILQKFRNIKEPIGLDCYDFADLKVLRADGTYCAPMEMGRLVANSPTAMKGYHNNPEATKNYFITDAYGKIWGDLACYGYVDRWNKVYVKGRIGKNDPKVKTFQIADVIMRDYSNIMSCEVINVSDDMLKPKYVAHVEPQYYKHVNMDKTLKRAAFRVQREFGPDIAKSLYFRVRNNEEGFPTLFTAKRNVIELKSEKISEKCISYDSLISAK